MTDPPTYADLLAQLEGLMADVPPLPLEIAASDRETLDALLAGVPKAQPPQSWGSPLGNLLSVPVRVDDTLPPGRVEVRERDGRVSTALQRVDGQWISLPLAGWPDMDWRG
jgi:hypothetical protein